MSFGTRMFVTLMAMTLFATTSVSAATLSPAQIAKLEKAYQGGSDDAAMTLGDYYLNNIHTSEGVSDSILWYKRSANAGNFEAACALYSLYSGKRKGAAIDNTAAQIWLTKAKTVFLKATHVNINPCK